MRASYVRKMYYIFVQMHYIFGADACIFAASTARPQPDADLMPQPGLARPSPNLPLL